ncbi:hypothetical protein JCM10449v2_007857 [Rhodotorula kratochvilovae]
MAESSPLTAPAELAMPPVDAIVGAFVVGTLLSTFLAGVTTAQAWTYFVAFGAVDRRALVLLVSVLKAIGMAHTAICCHTIYLWTVSEYGNLYFLAKCPIPFAWGPLLTGLTAFLVQCFYAWRVFVVSSRRSLIPLLIGVIALVQLAFATGMTYMFYLWDFAFVHFEESRYGVAIWLLCGVAADILITASLIHYLRACLRTSDEQQWRPLVRAIIANTVQTNGITCIATIINATVFLTDTQHAWHVIPGLILVQLYIVSALVSLNSRTALQQRQPARASSTRITTSTSTPGPRGSNSPLVVPSIAARSRTSSGSGSLRRAIVRSESKRSIVEAIRVTQFRQISVGTQGEASVEKQLGIELGSSLPRSASSSLDHSASFPDSIAEEPESPVCASPRPEGRW